ncbi:MFS transporter [Flagellimonas halotolerans]|uniref:MFS transporter n=1 Tax=Flagellimonas halotolerans TaxID=3112164 RepID=A0ABU6ISV2_9FLAO|nr:MULTISPECIES: MFS transporter [unclassified Allomuricauda]MEC3966351.1 MFS transporter [Muricauda sp. SYSU M86414]MEC4266216.1 MFS transporter [Muricauda sp. SYSU M84420]
MGASNIESKNTRLILFYASCFAVITNAFSFSIRAGILPQLGEELNLSGEELGYINSMWFLGFPISMIIGGLVYNKIGGKLIMQFAFFAHTIGIIMTIYSGSYAGLLISTLLIGFGNGCTEAACNPMIADLYKGNTIIKMMNRFHMWFPGGIVIGALISKYMTDGGFGWQSQIWILLVPTLIYAYLFYGKPWPEAKTKEEASLSYNFKAMGTPLFIFMLVCMSLTAASEFGPQQWVGLILARSGAEPMLILALVTGLMAVVRYFGGAVVKKLDQTGVFLAASVLTLIGIFLFSTQTGSMAYVAAIIYAFGIAYFWPNMLGFVAEKIPKSGAIGLSVIGSVGMVAGSFFQPIIGAWIDSNRAIAKVKGITGDELELVAGQATMQNMTIFPAILIVLFIILFIWVKKIKQSQSL